jgi:hypothetical protein
MRRIFTIAILLCGLQGADTKLEPKSQESLLAADENSLSSPIEFTPSTSKSDREIVLAVSSPEGSEEGHDREEEAAEPPQLSSPASAAVESDDAAPQSLDQLCLALLTSAENSDLPVPFFANLLWQESRLRHDAVSPVGAQGIAQFMPQVADEVGLGDPFDPRQAIRASARFLHALRAQFGNLGFVAAAYNAGAHRVSEWLTHRRRLPRETRTYVARVTGRTVDEWRKEPPSDSALMFARPLPCRGLPAFADLENDQLELAMEEQSEERQVARSAEQTAPSEPRLIARRKHVHRPIRSAAVGKVARKAGGREPGHTLWLRAPRQFVASTRLNGKSGPKP